MIPTEEVTSDISEGGVALGFFCVWLLGVSTVGMLPWFKFWHGIAAIVVYAAASLIFVPISGWIWSYALRRQVGRSSLKIVFWPVYLLMGIFVSFFILVARLAK
ncbi:hypothetical protein [Tsuneonella amylolytica]|uniref:hypothetical protein n=1 Tax=Tsuneonella amylolytica TaxID=2338327 RepID=UPI0013C4FFBC|nr:hypothetical protein [Tsuneonella amylolytica]